MTIRYWTNHWQFRYWRPEINQPGVPLRASGGNQFRRRGIVGDCGQKAYVVSIFQGQLYLGGRMSVSRVISRAELAIIRGTDQFYPAEEWLVDETAAGGTLLHLTRRLAPEVTRQIKCIFANGDVRGLFFLNDEKLDPQATRGVRELTEESANLLDRIIELTDSMPQSADLLTVTQMILNDAMRTRT